MKKNILCVNDNLKINIVTVATGWILQKIAERINKSHPEVFSLSTDPRNDVHANYYVDVQNCYVGKTQTLDVGYFTHLHENSMTHIRPLWLTLDHIVHKCTRYHTAFKGIYPPEKMSILYPGEIDPSFILKKPTIGIFQRGAHTGKGFFFMKEMSKVKSMQNFKFLFKGTGWEEVVTLFNDNNIDAACDIDEDYSSYPKVYKEIDYLLIPSLWEGGPMSVIEACATGIPIISADVGWVNGDFKVDYLFQPNNCTQLDTILQSIYKPLEDRRARVSHLTYKKYGTKLINIIRGML